MRAEEEGAVAASRHRDHVVVAGERIVAFEPPPALVARSAAVELVGVVRRASRREDDRPVCEEVDDEREASEGDASRGESSQLPLRSRKRQIPSAMPRWSSSSRTASAPTKLLPGSVGGRSATFSKDPPSRQRKRPCVFTANTSSPRSARLLTAQMPLAVAHPVGSPSEMSSHASPARRQTRSP